MTSDTIILDVGSGWRMQWIIPLEASRHESSWCCMQNLDSSEKNMWRYSWVHIWCWMQHCRCACWCCNVNGSRSDGLHDDNLWCCRCHCTIRADICNSENNINSWLRVHDMTVLSRKALQTICFSSPTLVTKDLWDPARVVYSPSGLINSTFLWQFMESRPMQATIAQNSNNSLV